MGENKIEKRECELIMELFNFGGVTTSYNTESGLSRHLKLSGQIDDDWYDDSYIKKSSAFHQKPVRLDLNSPPPKIEVLEMDRAYFIGGAGGHCGVARINEGVEPERFDIDGEEHESEPIYIDLYLTPDAFTAICNQALDAFNNHLTMRATIALVGDALQQIKRDRSMPWPLKPRELDISVFHGYGVKSFEIYTRQLESTATR